MKIAIMGSGIEVFLQFKLRELEGIDDTFLQKICPFHSFLGAVGLDSKRPISWHNR